MNIFLKIFFIIFFIIIILYPFVAYSETQYSLKAYYFYVKRPEKHHEGDSWFIVQNLRTQTLVIIYYEKLNNKFIIVKGYKELLSAIIEKSRNNPVRITKPPHIDVVIINESIKYDAAGCRGRVLTYSDGSWIEVSNGLAIRGFLKTQDGYVIFFRLAYVEVPGPLNENLPCGALFFSDTTREMLVVLSIGVVILAARSVMGFRVENIIRSGLFVEESYEYY